ncbi:uncharacterized protein B0T15DRAFT_541258 [Chaetomium strumarium]|uniref:Uncharacterized protein n=1 Tax=Chaetomium strumarium TaxID=1170767 RepID=A0AAJ0GPK3_9PEZI|nr:hypothetical protein B0T15DRAFT_541258 [Chaetomium strumarium]
MQIQFKEDNDDIRNEIRIRETLIGRLLEARDIDTEMMRRFHVVPIQAVVLADGAASGRWAPGSVAGGLMPYCGPPLERFAIDEEKATELPVTGRQLQELVQAVRDLDGCGVKLGWREAAYGGIVFQSGTGGGEGRLLFADFGSLSEIGIVWGKKETKSMGRLLRWCAQRAHPLRNDSGARQCVLDMARKLESVTPL